MPIKAGIRSDSRNKGKEWQREQRQGVIAGSEVRSDSRSRAKE